ncbi:MAG TPA: redoxin family protein [Pyrinomonadaceae bacterium]|jgi:thiol-disulfide isomerase/thioredoxin
MSKFLTLAAIIILTLASSRATVSAQQTTPAAPSQKSTPSPTAAPARTPAPTHVPAQTPTATPTTAPPAAAPAPPATGLVRTPDGHEYAPLQERTINYKDWTFKSLKDGTPVNLREWSKGKRLVLVLYYAPWCGNWKLEAPVAARLHEKYKQHGFDIIAVNEYGAADDATRKYFADTGSSYTVVVESEGREARDQTTHYTYRQACGDPRRWGSPFNIFLEPSKLNKTGEVLTEKAWIVGGELVEDEVEKFIRQRLGLGDKASK